MIAVFLACLAFQDPREVPTAGKHESLVPRPCRRDDEHYLKLARRAGGGRDSDRALLAALDWLARHQGADGSWDGSIEVTSAALLAFVGAGFSTWAQEDCRPKMSPRSHATPVCSSEALRRLEAYAQAVRRAIAFLRRYQDPSGFIGLRGSPDALRGHAVATTALCDVYGWAPLLILREPTVQAIRALEEEPISTDDPAVAGWAALAFRSAALDLLPFSRPAAERFQLGLPAGEETRRRAAIDLLLRRLSSKRTRLPDASRVAWDADRADPEDRFWITTALLRYDGVEGPMGRRWIPALVEILLSRQGSGAGDSRGSWEPIGAGSRAAATAFHAMCLAAFYETPVFGTR